MSDDFIDKEEQNEVNIPTPPPAMTFDLIESLLLGVTML